MPFLQPQKQPKQRRKTEAYHPLQIPSLASLFGGDLAEQPRATPSQTSPNTLTMGRKSQRPATGLDTRDIGAMLQKPKQTQAGDQPETEPELDRHEMEVPQHPLEVRPAQADPMDESAPTTRGDLKI
ncbi:Hypothetical predicted protein [Pelobates cultripes]|uniref:Uncharacterized protein n=1 Tax=Pelobates cultripes TaxID=61616 RepID=A0AAD1TD47_PELCU|nr:Hypothetical predicted protein [Pelobates cultripes]